MCLQDFGLSNFGFYAAVWNDPLNKIKIIVRENYNLMKGREETQPLKISEILYISSLLSNSIPPSCKSTIHPSVSIQSSIHPSNPNVPLCPGADTGHWRYRVRDSATVVPDLMKFLALAAPN